MKKNLSGAILVLVFFLGLSILLYPALSDCWNSRVQSRAIVNYEQLLSGIDETGYDEMLAAADEFNRMLTSAYCPIKHFDMISGYEDALNIGAGGIMGYISIEKIGVELPVYHGTSDAVLNIAAGHLEGTSLPVGGESTHAVISAHRGLPSSKLFTNLDRLEKGDTFTVTVLNRVLTYEVERTLIIEPDDISALGIIEGEDHCTLMTCTPYGINSHRLLVCGTRIETIAERPQIFVPNEAYIVDKMIVTPVIAAPMLLILLAFLLIKYSGKKNRKH